MNEVLSTCNRTMCSLLPRRRRNLSFAVQAASTVSDSRSEQRHAGVHWHILRCGGVPLLAALLADDNAVRAMLISSSCSHLVPCNCHASSELVPGTAQAPSCMLVRTHEHQTQDCAGWCD